MPYAHPALGWVCVVLGLPVFIRLHSPEAHIHG